MPVDDSAEFPVPRQGGKTDSEGPEMSTRDTANPKSEIRNPKSETRNPTFPSSFSLYIHIPYCIRKCPYCDFNSHVVADIPEQAYTRALLQELEHCAAESAWARRSIKTVFFGGGTPSTFKGSSIGAVLEKAAALFSFDDGVEITLEANPGTVDTANFGDYRRCGVNRMSIGAQTFDARLLEFLGRIHSAQDTHRALDAVRAAGFDNFNVDLIFAIPGQTLGAVRHDLAEALRYEPPHLSVYNLTIEEGTPFHARFQCGQLHPLEEDTEIRMADLVAATLNDAALRRYEISNYARGGFAARHNLTYWTGGDYLGIGAGAHSFFQGTRAPCGVRRQNERMPARYMRRIAETGRAMIHEETPDRRRAMGEFLFTGLRLLDGISLSAFEERFGTRPENAFPQVAAWLDDGLLLANAERLHFTEPGLLLANELFVDFV